MGPHVRGHPKWGSDQVLMGVLVSFPFSPCSPSLHPTHTYLQGGDITHHSPWSGSREGWDVAKERWRKDSRGFLIHFRQICKMVKKSTASYLEPYLQTLPGLEPPPHFSGCLQMPWHLVPLEPPPPPSRALGEFSPVEYFSILQS